MSDTGNANFPFRGSLLGRAKLPLFASPLAISLPKLALSKRAFSAKVLTLKSAEKIHHLFQMRWGLAFSECQEPFQTTVKKLHEEILDTLKLFSTPLLEPTQQIAEEISSLQKCFSESNIDEFFSLYHALTLKGKKMQKILEKKLQQIEEKIINGVPEIADSNLQTLKEISSVGFENLRIQTQKSTQQIQQKLKKQRSLIIALAFEIQKKLEELNLHFKSMELALAT